MSILSCACPKPSALTAITAVSCAFKIDQTVRLAFVRNHTASLFPVSSNAITALASWTANKALTNSNKHIISPLFSNPQLPQSEALEEGGNDNTTVNGIPLYMGEGFVKFTGQFRNLEPAIADQLRLLSCESEASAAGAALLGAYFINRAGNIFHKLDGDDEPLPIEIYNFRTSSRGTEGFAKDDILNFSFYMDGNWDSGLSRTLRSTLDFNPLTQL